MTSKERVKAAIEKKPSDKVPLGFYVVDHDTIAKVIGRPTYLRNKPGFFKACYIEGRRDEVVESMKQDIVDFYNKIDCVDLLTLKEAQEVPPKGFKPEKELKKIDDNTYENEKGIWKLEENHNDLMFMPFDKELKTYTESDFEDRTLPEKLDPSCFELSDHLISNFKDSRYILGFSGGVTAVAKLGGTENALMTMALQPEVIKAYNEQMVFQQSCRDKDMIRPGIDGVLLEQDMAGTNGPLVSPDMFKDLCFPYYKQRIEQVKKSVPHVLLHNCGNNLPIMDMLIEGGIDGYESIQTNSEMDLKLMLEKYGDKICAWGAIPLEVLISGTEDDTRQAVRDCFKAAKGFDGFIVGPSHSIAFGTKYENFMTMLDEFVALREKRLDT